MSHRASLALALLLGLAACTTPKPWEGGVPPDGTRLTDDERVHQYAKFAPSRFDPHTVVIHEGTEDVRYTTESFRPVMDSLDPKIYPEVAKTAYPTVGVALAAVGAATFSAAAAGRVAGSKAQLYDYAAAGACALTGALLGHWIDGKLSGALKTYLERLDRRLFPARP